MIDILTFKILFDKFTKRQKLPFKQRYLPEHILEDFNIKLDNQVQKLKDSDDSNGTTSKLQ